MQRAPVRLTPSFRKKVWGTTQLAPLYPDSGEKIGEVWFLSDEPLPLLVKFIFTSERLSVQVHPDDAYAGAHGGTRGKTEMWHILRAEPGARIALGFREQLSGERVRRAAETGEIEELLQWIDAGRGGTFLVRAGTVHAIGAGIALCEIQQNSDITYRLYDYGRPRELHLDQAMEVLRREPHPGKEPRRGSVLASCEYFITEEVLLDGAMDYQPDFSRFQLLITLEGRGRLGENSFRAGEVWHIPAGAGRFRMEGSARFLKTFVP